MKKISMLLFGLFGALGFLLFFRFVPDYLWFGSFGKLSVWLLTLKAQVGFFIGGTFVAALWFFGNIWITRHLLKKFPTPAFFNFSSASPLMNQIFGGLFHYSKNTFGPAVSWLVDSAILLFGFGASVLFGLVVMGKWMSFLLAFHTKTFGQLDPIFGLDLSFYLMQLPVLEFLYAWVLGLVVLSLFFVLFIYVAKRLFFVLFGQKQDVRMLRWHLGGLLVVLCALLAVGAWLGRFDILYAKSGVLYGAGYTKHHVDLPLSYLMSVLWLVEAGCVFFWIRRGVLKPMLIGFSVILLMSFLAGPALTKTVQAYTVAPNELALEKPYLEHTIAFTRKAYKLDHIQSQFFPVQNTLTYAQLQEHDSVLRNIRLWDEEPLRKTFSQLQEIRQYYEFQHIDVDRYWINGEIRQVLLSPREMEIEQLSAQAQTWINRHLVYTHGYGLCMSPVNEVSSEGLPSFYIKDIPPVLDQHFVLKRPELYFSQQESRYALVNTKQPEFDYPKGDKNVYTRYQGTGGIVLDSFWKRVVFAFKFSDVKLLISDLMTPKTRILYDRNISEIAQKVAPFLVFDRDPYLVVTPEGRLVWVLDAYTMSSYFPYSEPFARRMNYVRHSVKATIDAYDGTLNMYVIDDQDPLISGYRSLFSELFLPGSAMPDYLNQHARYPKDLFVIQSAMFCVYHMTDPQVFYNREDVWAFPEKSQPYYMVTRLPDAEKPQFILATPFTPANKHNMVAWMSVTCDPSHYGQMTVYKFPKEKTVYGPVQLESRIDQDTEISQSLTLWGQVGSSVIRGDLLVIPIENSLVYVEPIYLQSNQSQLPELKRVVFSYNDQVVMAETLHDAISGCFTEMTTGASRQHEKVDREDLNEKSILQELRRRYVKLRELINTELSAIDKALN